MEDGMELEETAKEGEQEAAVPTEPQLPSEFEKLFKVCEDNPEDFNSWVTLLQYVEQEVNDFWNLQLYVHEIFTRIKIPHFHFTWTQFTCTLNINCNFFLFAVFSQNVLTAARKSFDLFFLRYPYCYGYWKKYADLEKKHGNIQVAEEVNICIFFSSTMQ